MDSAVRQEATARLQAAAAIQGATRARLGVLGDAFVCADARFASYRRSDAEPQFADQWYVASQVWADAELLHVAAPAIEPTVSPLSSIDPRAATQRAVAATDDPGLGSARHALLP